MDYKISIEELENTSSKNEDRVLRNIAEITDDADKDGNDILFEENNAKCIYLNEYSLNDEGSYVYRNLDLYGLCSY